MDKPALRRWAKERRSQLDLPALSAILRERLTALPEWRTARRTLLYVPLPGEVDLLPLTQDSTRRWHLPRCAPGRRLAIHPFVPGESSLIAGPFGLLEPDPAVGETDPQTLDLVVVPALSLSENGARLGYGAGYYDRFLPHLSPRCVRVGALPDALLRPELPSDPWDIPLDCVVTETRCFRRERS